MLDSAILSLRRPSKQSYAAFHNHFLNVGCKEGPFPTLGGNSASLYDNREDTVALVRPAEEDPLTSFLRKNCSPLFLVSNPQSNATMNLTG